MEKSEADWLTLQLKNRIKQIFEPRYGGVLEDSDVVTIANNLTETMEILLKFKWRKNHGNNNPQLG